MFEKALSVITIIAVSVIFILYFAIKKKEEKDKYYFIAGSLMLVFGIILYAIGLFYEGSLNTPSKITLFASALMHALQSFAGYFEGEKVLKLMQASPLYEVALFFHFIASVLFTSTIVVKLIGKRVINAIKVHIVSRYFEKDIVLGSSQYANAFLKS